MPKLAINLTDKTGGEIHSIKVSGSREELEVLSLNLMGTVANFKREKAREYVVQKSLNDSNSSDRDEVDTVIKVEDKVETAKKNSVPNCEEPKTKEQVTITVDKTVYIRPGKPTLVAQKCSKCGRLFIGFKQVGDVIKCPCGANNTIKNTLIKSVLQCPNCGESLCMFTDADVNEIPCKKCESPIDLEYIEKLGYKISPR